MEKQVRCSPPATTTSTISLRYAWLRYSAQWGRDAADCAIHVKWWDIDRNGDAWLQSEWLQSEWFEMPPEQEGWESYRCDAEHYSLNGGIGARGIRGDNLHALLTECKPGLVRRLIIAKPILIGKGADAD